MADLPVPPGDQDTADLRSGPDLHPALLPFLPLVGVWQGTGRGGYPTIEDFDYGQRVTFSHDGRPFLRYESRAWIIGPDGEYVRAGAREVGWWRPGGTSDPSGASGADEFEALLAHPTGIVEVYLGRATSATRWELATDVVARTTTAKEVTGTRRLYGIVEGMLLYAVDMAAVGQPPQPHLSARLARVGG